MSLEEKIIMELKTTNSLITKYKKQLEKVIIGLYFLILMII